MAEAEEIGRDEFFAQLSQTEAALVSKINTLQRQVVGVRMLRAQVYRAEEDGLRVSFYDGGDTVFFVANKKPRMGFGRG